jgi:hypothetical protein
MTSSYSLKAMMIMPDLSKFVWTMVEAKAIGAIAIAGLSPLRSAISVDRVGHQGDRTGSSGAGMLRRAWSFSMQAGLRREWIEFRAIPWAFRGAAMYIVERAIPSKGLYAGAVTCVIEAPLPLLHATRDAASKVWATCAG